DYYCAAHYGSGINWQCLF
nr:immunoglobulin light chain junction region [Macaca mulatta]